MKIKITTLLNYYIVRLFNNPKTIQLLNNSAIKQFLPGQALVTLLVFVAISTVVISGAVAVTIINSQTTSKFAVGEEALSIAEAGADNAILKLLRTPSYSAGSIPTETLSVGNGTANIVITGPPDNISIESKGTMGSFIRTIQVKGNYTNTSNVFTVTSYQEID